MGLVIIFTLMAILAGIGAYRAIKSRNYLATFWGLAAFLVLGWFVVMTVLNHGIPAGKA